ncbi:MAG: acyl-CoA dehydrogenase [Rhodobiaceae bacterium]|nr:acyl-CoA dehydrogenase [Rhodobiaceae bacterium]MBT5518229.1 acyl-CoA dehydrogenase [Rhodobiaceae bacterium]
MINPFLNDERKAFHDSVAKFLEAEIWPHVDDWDEAGDYPQEVNEKICQLGVFGFNIPEQYGGLGFDDAHMRKASAVEMGRSSAGGVMASVGSRSIMLKPLTELATDEIKNRVLPELLSGRKGGALGITEPGGGSDVARMKTTARRDGDEWVLNGQKMFITGGMQASYFVIGARTGGDDPKNSGMHGISLFFVEADTPGFSRTPIERKMGWWASDTATLYFDECRIPASHIMGEENKGFFAIMDNFNYERFMMAAQMCGMSMRLFDECVAYAQTRETFGETLISHQVIRHKLADMSARIDAMDAYLNQVAEIMNTDKRPVAEISKLKFYCSTNLEWIASAAMQIFGGAGYLRGNAVERIYREVKVQAIGGGSEEIMRDLAMKQMGL